MLARPCFALLLSAAFLTGPLPALGAVAVPPGLAEAARALDAVKPARVRRGGLALRESRARRPARMRRARGSSNPAYSNIRPNATLPLSIMVPEPGNRQPPPPAVRAIPARPLPPLAAGGRPTIVPPAVTPNPETFSDRVVRCTHSAGVNGISPGRQGVYVSGCAM